MSVTEDLEGVRAIAAGKVPFDLNEDILSAIAHGLAYDADPTYWAQDIGARRKIALTEEGLTVAQSHGWLITCECRGCDLETATESLSAERQAHQRPPYARFCSGCYSSGSHYSFYGDQCGLHFKASKRAKERVDL